MYFQLLLSTFSTRKKLDSCTSALFRPKAIKLLPRAACGSKAGYRGGCNALLATECNATCGSVTAQVELHQPLWMQEKLLWSSSRSSSHDLPQGPRYPLPDELMIFYSVKKGIMQNYHDGSSLNPPTTKLFMVCKPRRKYLCQSKSFLFSI